MNLSARAVPSRHSGISDDRIVLTLRPAGLMPGEYSYTTSSESLRRMLRCTDLPSTVIEKFQRRMWSPKGANLPAIDLSEGTLTEIGYFVD